jgi:hypothetical protein
MRALIRNSLSLQQLPAWLSICAAAILSWLYFRVNSIDRFSPFYDAARTEFLSADVGILRNAQRSGVMDEWQTMVYRTALGRWRLRPMASEPFDNLMRDFSSGWWTCSSAEEWSTMLQRLDDEWREARRRAIATASGQPGLSIRAQSNRAMVITFHGNNSSEIGSVIQVTFEVPQGHAPRSPIRVLWTTVEMPDLSPSRRRLAMVNPESGAVAGKQRFTIMIDMSWEPAWLSPATHPRYLALEGENCQEWNPIRAKFGDSDLLKP